MLSRSATGPIKRWVTVLLTIGAWLVLSNHCALALEDSAQRDSKAGECPMHSTPAKGKPAPNIPCCKDLRAVASHALKNIAARVNGLGGVQDYGVAVLLTLPGPKVQFVDLDTGPPHSLSFAESILQRSLFAHAPPAVFHRS
jgi:hypothetical protein